MPQSNYNSSVVCECGSSFKYQSRYSHNNSKKHKRYKAYLNDLKPPTVFNKIETIMETVMEEGLSSKTTEELKDYLSQINNILKE